MTDILIAFIFGAFVGACLLVAVSCMIVRGENNEDMLLLEPLVVVLNSQCKACFVKQFFALLI